MIPLPMLNHGHHAATDMGNTKSEKEVRAGPGQVAIWKILKGGLIYNVFVPTVAKCRL